MTLSDRYRRLARLIDALESQGLTVRSATPAGELPSGESSGEQLPVHLELELPSGATLDRLTDTAPEPVADLVDETVQDVSHPSTTERTTDLDDADDPATPAAQNGADTTEADPVDPDSDDDTAVGTADDTSPTEADPDATVDDAADETTADDTSTDGVSCTHPECDRTFETDRGMKIHRTKAHSLAELIDGGADEGVHCDPEVLAEVYEQYDTFAEMTDALDVDVGPQAVRKQMIRHDIHEPGMANPSTIRSSSSSSSSARDTDKGDTHSESVADGGVVADSDGVAADSPEVGTDSPVAPDADTQATDEDPVSTTESGAATTNGVEADQGTAEDAADGDSEDVDEPLESLPDLDLPASLSAEEFRAAVEEATTLYDVQRALGLDRETTRDLLREYDLLELVCGRAATVSEREELKTEIHERLHRAAT